MKVKLIPTSLPHCDQCVYEKDLSVKEPGALHMCIPELSGGCRDHEEGIKYYYTYDLPDGFKPIDTAPKDASYFIGVNKYDVVQKVHYACDLSGEEQPPYEGFFDEHCRSVETLVGWKELEEV